MIPSLNFTFLVILVATFSSSLSAKLKTKAGIIDFNENYDYAQLPSQTYGSVAPDYGYGSLDYPPYDAYQSEYGAPYYGSSPLGSQYGATLGTPLRLGAQYGAPLGTQCGAQYGTPLGTQYGAPLAAQYGTKYTAPLGAQYAAPYGVTAGLAPLYTDRYKYSRRLTW